MDIDREIYQPFVKINFNANVNVTQELTILDDEITPEQLVRGLNSGKYVTTLDSSSESGKIFMVVKFEEDTDNEIEIAMVESQETTNSFSNFVLLDSSDD